MKIMWLVFKMKFLYFILLMISFCGCGIQTQYEKGEVIDVFIEDEGSGEVLFSLVEHEGNNIHVTTGNPSAVDYLWAFGDSYIKIRILRKSKEPGIDYEGIYPHDAYKEYEVGDIVVGELRGQYPGDATTIQIRHHRNVIRDGNIIKLIFDDPNKEYITTTHSRFESTYIRIKIVEKAVNKDYDYKALYIETLTEKETQ